MRSRSTSTGDPPQLMPSLSRSAVIDVYVHATPHTRRSWCCWDAVHIRGAWRSMAAMAAAHIAPCPPPFYPHVAPPTAQQSTTAHTADETRAEYVT